MPPATYVWPQLSQNHGGRSLSTIRLKSQSGCRFIVIQRDDRRPVYRCAMYITSLWHFGKDPVRPARNIVDTFLFCLRAELKTASIVGTTTRFACSSSSFAAAGASRREEPRRWEGIRERRYRRERSGHNLVQPSRSSCEGEAKAKFSG